MEKFNQEKLLHGIKYTGQYLCRQFDLGEKILNELEGIDINKVDEKLQALIEIHVAITDYLPWIGQMSMNGCYMPAGNLASTVFELSHRGVYIYHQNDALQAFLLAHNTPDKGFDETIKANIRKIVEKNISSLGCSNIDSEYNIYKMLCNLKHSHPVFSRLITDGKITVIPGGKSSDKRALHNCNAVQYYSARCASYITALLLSHSPALFSEDCLNLREEVMKLKKECDEI